MSNVRRRRIEGCCGGQRRMVDHEQQIESPFTYFFNRLHMYITCEP